MDRRQIYLVPPKGLKINRFAQFIYRHIPKYWIWRIIRARKIDPSFLLIDRLLRRYTKVHIAPLRNSRGFLLTLDGQVSLWFNQEGNYFEYDGWEIGEYRDGDVTVLDKCPKVDLFIHG